MFPAEPGTLSVNFPSVIPGASKVIPSASEESHLRSDVGFGEILQFVQNDVFAECLDSPQRLTTCE